MHVAQMRVAEIQDDFHALQFLLQRGIHGRTVSWKSSAWQAS